MALAELSGDFDAVFIGSQIERDVTDEFDENGARLTFEVSAVYRGVIGEITQVYTHAQESACGATFNPGQETTVFVRERQGQPTVSLCDQFIEFEEGDLEAEFGPSTPPLPAAAVAPGGDSGEGGSSVLPWILAIGAALAVTAASVTFIGRRDAS